MPDVTTNYKLTKPLINENYSIAVFNQNADIVDEQMKKQETDLDTHRADKTNPHEITAGQIGAATTATYTAALSASGWSASAPHTQTVTVAGILETDNPITDIVLSASAATAALQLEAWGCVSRIDTGAGSITAVCFESKPKTSITIQMKAVR